MIGIRAATVDDCTALAELRWEFRSGRDAPVETRDAFVARCAAWMRDQLQHDWRAWVAAADGRIVGHVWLRAIEKIPNPVGQRERHAYLSNLYVSPASRGGVGTRLLETAVAWASDHGVDYVLLSPTDRSRTLYARHGFGVTSAFLGRQCR